MPALPMPLGEDIRQLSNSISAKLPSFMPRSLKQSEQSSAPLTSVFTVIGRRTSSIPSRAVEYLSQAVHLPRSGPFTSRNPISKRQNGILVIPTFYAGLSKGPAPGVVAAIVLGTVFGLILLLWLVWSILRLSGYFGSTTTIIEEEVIRRHSRSPRRSRSRSETIEIRSEHRSTPPRRERREEIVVEETFSSPEDDIVEVIEEHSPERRPSRRQSKRMSGFRTVNPAEFGGGDRPMRKVSRK